MKPFPGVVCSGAISGENGRYLKTAGCVFLAQLWVCFDGVIGNIVEGGVAVGLCATGGGHARQLAHEVKR